MYVCGPFQNASPQMHEITARVNTNTKDAGFNIISKILIKHTKSNKHIIPNEIAAFFMDLLSGKYENNLASRPAGGCYAYYFF